MDIFFLSGLADLNPPHASEYVATVQDDQTLFVTQATVGRWTKVLLEVDTTEKAPLYVHSYMSMYVLVLYSSKYTHIYIYITYIVT